MFVPKGATADDQRLLCFMYSRSRAHELEDEVKLLDVFSASCPDGRRYLLSLRHSIFSTLNPPLSDSLDQGCRGCWQGRTYCSVLFRAISAPKIPIHRYSHHEYNHRVFINHSWAITHRRSPTRAIPGRDVVHLRWTMLLQKPLFNLVGILS